MNTANWNTRDLTICLLCSDSKGIPFHLYITTLIQDDVHFCPKVASGIIFLGLTFICAWHSYNFGSLGKTYSYLSWLRIGAIIICSRSPLVSISEALDGNFFLISVCSYRGILKESINKHKGQHHQIKLKTHQPTRSASRVPCKFSLPLPIALCPCKLSTKWAFARW